MSNKFRALKDSFQLGFAKVQLNMRECLMTIVFILMAAGILSAQNIAPTAPKIKRNDLKFTILSIGSGSSRLTYERAFGSNMSAELTMGIIGWGYDFLHHLDSKGFLIKAAYKWNLIPMKSANSPLAGFYVKPELVFVNFDYAPMQPKTEPQQTTYSPKHTTHAALLAECGYQLLLKWFVFDVYCGVGPALGTGNDENYYHSFMLLPRDSWAAFTAGFRVGVAF